MGDAKSDAARRVPLSLLALSAYAMLAVVWAAPVSLSPRDTVYNLGDPLHEAWVMAWDAHQVIRNPLALHKANGFFPFRRSLVTGEHLLPEAALLAPVFWATGNAVLASNLAVLAALTFSALAMFLLVRDLTGSAAAAFLSGLAYAFNSLTLHELPRLHVLNIQWWPLALMWLLRYARAGRPRDAWLSAAALILQGLSGTYYLVYTGLFAPFWIAGAYFAVGRRPPWREAGTLALALVLVALPAGFVLQPYWTEFRALGLEKRLPQALLDMSGSDRTRMREMGFEPNFSPGADLAAYWNPDASNPLWGRFSGPQRAELPHFLGYFGLLLMAIGILTLAPRRHPLAGRVGGLALFTLGAALLLSLGHRVRIAGVDFGRGPYDAIHRYLPLARGMATPERFGALVIFGGAILAGLGAAALLRRLSGGPRAATFAALALLLPCEHWSPPAPPEAVPSDADVPEVYRWLNRDGEGPVIELPLFSYRNQRLWAAYQYFSTYHWRPIPIGRTSFYPPVHDFLAWQLRGFPDGTSLRLLDRLGIRTLVVHPKLWDEDERVDRLSELETDPQVRLVRRFDTAVAERFSALGLGDERIYRLIEGAPGESTPCVPEGELPRQAWQLFDNGIASPDLARDGDRRTAWATWEPQALGDFLRVVFPRAETVSVAVIEMSYPYGEFPRGLEVMVPGPRGSWDEVPWTDGVEEKWELLRQLAERPQEARLAIRFAPQTVTSLTLALGRRDREWASPRWSVPELRLYRSCR